MGRHDVSGDYIIYDRVVIGHRFRHGEQGTNIENKKIRKFLLCLRGVSYALFISCWFLTCAVQRLVWWGERGRDKVNSLCPANLLRPDQHILPCFTQYLLAAPAWTRLFWAQMALPALVAISGPKIVSIFRAHPFQWPSKWMLPHQNHFVPPHINMRDINS